jgi:hypothetical protein
MLDIKFDWIFMHCRHEQYFLSKLGLKERHCCRQTWSFICNSTLANGQRWLRSPQDKQHWYLYIYPRTLQQSSVSCQRIFDRDSPNRVMFECCIILDHSQVDFAEVLKYVIVHVLVSRILPACAALFWTDTVHGSNSILDDFIFDLIRCFMNIVVFPQWYIHCKIRNISSHYNSNNKDHNSW